MTLLSAHFRKYDWWIMGSVLGLSFLGLFFIYSTTHGEGEYFIKQSLFLSIGIVVMTVISFFDWRGLRDNPYLILFLYILAVISLVGLFFFAPSIRGTKSWYHIAGISVDPIEFTKIILLILIAKYFSQRHIEMYRIQHIILSGFYTFVPAVLVIKQPDLGSSIILMVLWIGMLVISGIKLRDFFILCLIGIFLFSLGWFYFLKDYQKERITTLFIPEHDPLGISWSQRQSKIAIGAGGLFGQGFMKGSQTQHGFLTESHTDFIFSAIAEELGVVGVATLLFLLFLLLWRIIKIALESRTNFPRLFASGLAIIIICQVFINIGMNLGISPVIGITLPFVSYGGSSLLAMFISLGIIQSIKTH